MRVSTVRRAWCIRAASAYRVREGLASWMTARVWRGVMLWCDDEDGAGTLDGISRMTALTILDLYTNAIAGMFVSLIDSMLLRCVSRATAWSVCVSVV